MPLLCATHAVARAPRFRAASHAAVAPPFGNLLFTIRDKSRAIAVVIGGIAARRARPARCLSVRLSGL